jgi:hypothetical protein
MNLKFRNRFIKKPSPRLKIILRKKNNRLELTLSKVRSIYFYKWSILKYLIKIIYWEGER